MSFVLEKNVYFRRSRVVPNSFRSNSNDLLKSDHFCSCSFFSLKQSRVHSNPQAFFGLVKMMDFLIHQLFTTDQWKLKSLIKEKSLRSEMKLMQFLVNLLWCLDRTFHIDFSASLPFEKNNLRWIACQDYRQQFRNDCDEIFSSILILFVL